jgi:hypothetical protein
VKRFFDVLADHFGAPFIKTTLNYSRAPRANPQAWAIPHYNHAVSAAVAQWIEYWPPKPRVVGSIPASRTILCIANTRQVHFLARSINAVPMQDTLVYWFYRASAYVVLNVGEDAALVAIMFC